MTVRRLLEGKGDFVSVIRSQVRIQDVMDQLEVDDVAALVVSDDGQNILGIVSNRDVVRGLRDLGPSLAEQPIGNVMTRDVVTVDIGDSMQKVLELMDSHQIHHIPITDHGRLCGIVNILDVIRYRLDELEAEAEALRHYVAGDMY